jgi:hypothetical protein
VTILSILTSVFFCFLLHKSELSFCCSSTAQVSTDRDVHSLVAMPIVSDVSFVPVRPFFFFVAEISFPQCPVEGGGQPKTLTNTL